MTAQEEQAQQILYKQWEEPEKDFHWSDIEKMIAAMTEFSTIREQEIAEKAWDACSNYEYEARVMRIFNKTIKQEYPDKEAYLTSLKQKQ